MFDFIRFYINDKLLDLRIRFICHERDCGRIVWSPVEIFCSRCRRTK